MCVCVCVCVRACVRACVCVCVCVCVQVQVVAIMREREWNTTRDKILMMNMMRSVFILLLSLTLVH